jgi:hypothetical protein
MCMKKRRSLKRFLILLVLLLVLAGGAWTAIWYVVAGRLIAHEADWEQARQAEGWTIRHDPPRRTGWPMAAGMALGNLSVSGGGAYLPGGVSWTAASVTLALDIRHPNDLSLAVSGRQTLAVGGGAPLAFQARRFTGQAALLPGDRLGLMQFAAEDLLAAVPRQRSARPASIARLAAALRFDPAADAKAPALAVAAEFHDIHLPASHMAALGDPSLLSFDFTVTGPVPEAVPGVPAVQSGAAWARAGGSMTVNSFQLADGPLTLAAQGRFGLDSGLRPQGQAKVQARGLAPALDRLAAKKVMTVPEARAMIAMLGILAPASGPGVLTAPVTLHDGDVNLGPIPLLRLRP